MYVERKSFLLLATAIAAATIVAPGCSSADDSDTESGTGAASATGADPSGLGAKCIAEPGKGEAARPANFAEGYCFDLAVHEHPARSQVAPSSEGIGSSFSEGVGGTFDDFIFDQCNMYRSVYRAGMGTELKSCLDKADKKRKTNGVATKPVDAMDMYACGKLLFGVCDTDAAIDGRLHAKDSSGKSTCERIVDTVGASINAGDGTKIAFDVRTCERVLSGLRSTGRAQMKSCVTSMAKVLGKADVFYSCMEGLQADFSFVSASERGDAPEKFCWPATEGADVPGAEVCADIAKRTKIGIEPFLEAKCNEYRTTLVPTAAFLAVTCLQDSKNVDRDAYACGTKGMKTICQDSSLDAACSSYVAKVTSADAKANLGGRATRECRALLPAIKAEHREKVLACADQRVTEFAKFGAAKFALYSCIESGGK